MWKKERKGSTKGERGKERGLVVDENLFKTDIVAVLGKWNGKKEMVRLVGRKREGRKEEGNEVREGREGQANG